MAGRAIPEHVTATGTARLVPEGTDAWVLELDGTPQSHVDLADPRHLAFEYVRRLGHVLDEAAPEGRPLDVLHLGGGALTLPRYVAATRPGSRQRVVEVDGPLTELVRARLPLRREVRVRVRVEDARAAVESLREASVDVVVGDVYAGARVPAHLTTVEYAAAVARLLRPEGLYTVNLADGPPLTFLRGQVATLRAVFGELVLLAEPAVLRGRRFGNAVLVASARPLPVDALVRRAAADPIPARVVAGEVLDRFAGSARPVHDADAAPSPAPPPGWLSG